MLVNGGVGENLKHENNIFRYLTACDAAIYRKLGKSTSKPMASYLDQKGLYLELEEQR